LQLRASAEESRYLYYYTCQPSKIKWIAGLSASVRPMITYTFFILYIGLKVADFLKVGHMAPIWTDEDQGIFCAVIGFWFGQHAFAKIRKGRGNAY